MTTQVGKWGNSLAVRIPLPYAKDLGLEEGQELDVSLASGGLLLRPLHRGYTLEELVAGIKPENVHGETEWGGEVGREAW
jgi:antitoxin MazE